METVIPKVTQKVKFVKGEHKNEIGTIQSKDKKKQTVIILMDETLDVVEAKLDDVCDFVEL